MLEIALIYLAAAIVAVPIAKRVGLGSVLGYLIAGILIGPYALGIVGDQTDVMHFAEFGVVMMLFLVGLELQPARLWKLRHSILGLGGLQVVLTAAAIFAFCYWVFTMHWQTALAIGLMLALSSTAIVLQSLEEKGWLKQEAGQNAFSVLLFQDIAIIPILALLPLLAFAPQSSSKDISDSIIASWPVWQQVGVSVAVIAAIIAGGKYVSAPLFRYIAQTHMREIFTIFALFLVVAIALVMQSIGLSPALGTFLAGVVLAESEFRHELEADIEPFKGLLLGLFFITVGASINFELLADEFTTVIALVALLIVVKACILFALAITFNISKKQRLLFALALAQGGEFAFVLLSVTTTLSILTPEQTSLVTLVVAVSMLVAPLLLMAYEQLQKRTSNSAPEFDKPEQISSAKHVIIAGYGRFGQIMGRLLHAQGYEITVLDHSPSQIELLRRFGNTVFYGDAARQELLEAAGAHTAQMLIVAIDDADKTLEIIKLAHKNYPQLKIVARAIDRRHAYQLLNLKVDAFNRETVDSAINLAVDALELLGNNKEDAQRAGKLFRDHDRAAVLQLAELWGDDASYGVAVRQRMEDLKQVLQQDKQAQSDLNTCDSGDCEDGLTELADRPKKPDDSHLE
ncbi:MULTISPECIES: monovalent cation:proton antiporter-2 (CPA2) family protein [Pseudoalteromonas]|uniref:Glutathione-regulated potassium-efflux system protein KefB n=1 Tax=Pseudoalteromonas agarivorans DSM 14585 TaxID=1312369 RepID=A0ACA8E0Z4_9GAMM|nr:MULTISPECIES: monovalent cation:proton antiporter-2 (CPA2) family protein [Pseudoalteromonas]MCQ8887117.1 monovalent cation:proton antiporter-2 (CPA2) family protein [Pseudoalteromonas agarivorans]ATC83936.1 glutathione-regulated potassium-efflux system protein KefB [Pseudoalteromonas agarivorans DSM 14585]KPV89913.1 Glutathione-regulated potassium-efflux system protein KefC [Pseudoalteromonas sp. P1-30]MDC9514216.1 monovalent cation:proton antiporter-2 (CPA2) family protein [Pseudoalteromon